MTTTILLFALFATASANDLTLPRLVNTVSTRTVEFKAVRADGDKPIDLVCGHVTQPNPIDTPNPNIGQSGKVVVDFLVSSEGTVESAFILESTNGSANRNTFKALHSWKFRPATCNGAPMSAEGRITFRQ